MSAPTEIADFFGPCGPIAKKMPDFEVRPGQVEMAQDVGRVLSEGGHLVAEAGTGVGKSFAYLLPAALRSLNGDGPCVVATHTISLQEQLVEKDLPLLREVLGTPLRAVLVKGRSNYLCVRRLVGAGSGQLEFFGGPQGQDELQRIVQWAQSTRDGSRADLGHTPSAGLWMSIASESGACLGPRCRFADRCFYLAARRRMAGAHLLIVNHALLMSDLALRNVSRAILPRYDTVILDEAHALERAADENLGTDVSNFAVRMALDLLSSPRSGRGLFRGEKHAGLRAVVREARETAEFFFDDLAEWLDGQGGRNARLRDRGTLSNRLSPLLDDLADEIQSYIPAAEDSFMAAEFQAAAQRLQDLSSRIDAVVTLQMPGHAFWVEQKGRDGRILSLRSAPLHAGESLRLLLFDHVRSAVLTSATLSTGGEAPFQHLSERLGLSDPEANVYASPFDFARQVTLYVAQNLPEPTAQGFAEAALESIRTHLTRSRGRAFVLFTSYRFMATIVEGLQDFFQEQDYEIYVQGRNLPRTAMLERFRSHVHSVLFGTTSFWEGVDVRGEALSNVIITRLPFAVPTHPLTEARMERIAEEGGNPFKDFTLPEAVLRLKQGFGRLIRTATDTGSVVLLDRRVVSRSYGRHFLAALPSCKIVYE